MARVFVTDLVSQITCCITPLGLLHRWMIIYGNSTLTDPKFAYPVRVNWGQGADTMLYWNELCASSIEMFGLPGDRFITDISAKAMTWTFRDDRDALLFKLKFSEVAC